MVEVVELPPPEELEVVVDIQAELALLIQI